MVTKLWNIGYKQRQIAELLGITQPVVSEMVHSKPKSGPFSLEVDRLSDKIVKQLSSNWDAKAVIEMICQSCKNFKLRGVLCPVHLRLLPSLEKTCNVCMWLESSYAIPGAFHSMSDVSDSVRLLESESENVIPLYPQVGINITRIVGGTSDMVIGIPGRIVEYRGRLRAFSPPEIGGSLHNGAVLMEARKAGSQREAVANVRFVEGMESFLTEMGLKYRRALRRSGLPIESRENELLEEVERAFRDDPIIDVLIDPGSFGIEPSTYFFADSAVQAVKLLVGVGSAMIEARGT